MSSQLASNNVSSLLDVHLPHHADAAWYRGSEIPAKKLNNAIAKYAGAAVGEQALALGDGTVFGSAKEGVLITTATIYAGTTEGKFSLPLASIVGATRINGWPNYGVEITSCDGQTHTISMSCFEKQQDGMIDFLDCLSTSAATSVGEPAEQQAYQASSEPAPHLTATVATSAAAPFVTTQLAKEAPAPPAVESHAAPLAATVAGIARSHDTSVRAINAGFKLMGVCPRAGYEDAGELFATAFSTSEEWPLLKGHCQYVGYNARQVDALFLVTNRRLLLFSTEMAGKIVFVEITKRLLGKLPVPFLDSLVGFFLFSIPRSIYVACKGGKQQMIARSLETADEALLSGKPPLRKVQEFDFAKLAEIVSQVDVGTGVSTGWLARKFGVSFPPKKLGKTFATPNDLILSENESTEPFARLLQAISPTLSTLGLEFRQDESGQELTIAPAASPARTAA